MRRLLFALPLLLVGCGEPVIYDYEPPQHNYKAASNPAVAPELKCQNLVVKETLRQGDTCIVEWSVDVTIVKSPLPRMVVAELITKAGDGSVVFKDKAEPAVLSSGVPHKFKGSLRLFVKQAASIVKNEISAGTI